MKDPEIPPPTPAQWTITLYRTILFCVPACVVISVWYGLEMVDEHLTFIPDVWKLWLLVGSWLVAIISTGWFDGKLRRAEYRESVQMNGHMILFFGVQLIVTPSLVFTAVCLRQLLR